MLIVGVTIISFSPATVTSYFGSVDREAEQTRPREFRDERQRVLIRLDSRLPAIERALHSAPPS